jgi:hypothetical protein
VLRTIGAKGTASSGIDSRMRECHHDATICSIFVPIENGVELMKEKTPLTPEAFCAALVSALVSEGITSIRPRSAIARKGFSAVLKFLDRVIDREKDRDRLYALLKIRTSLAPSLSGAYDNFEMYFRALQTSRVSSPNPALADLRFNVSPAYARSSLNQLDPNAARLIETAAEEFKNLGKPGAHERRPRISHP